jgi:hypothetical protein
MERVPNVTDMSWPHFSKHFLGMTSTPFGTQMSVIPEDQNAPSSITLNLEEDPKNILARRSQLLKHPTPITSTEFGTLNVERVLD